MYTVKNLQFIKLFLAVEHLYIDIDGVTWETKQNYLRPQPESCNMQYKEFPHVHTNAGSLCNTQTSMQIYAQGGTTHTYICAHRLVSTTLPHYVFYIYQHFHTLYIQSMVLRESLKLYNLQSQTLSTSTRNIHTIIFTVPGTICSSQEHVWLLG